MGIQVTVEIEDLPADWEHEVRVEERYHWDDDLQEEIEIPVNRLWVKFPVAGWVSSYMEDALVFDNKFANMNLVDELKEAGVKYVRS